MKLNTKELEALSSWDDLADTIVIPQTMDDMGIAITNAYKEFARFVYPIHHVKKRYNAKEKRVSVLQIRESYIDAAWEMIAFLEIKKADGLPVTSDADMKKLSDLCHDFYRIRNILIDLMEDDPENPIKAKNKIVDSQA